jgi:hypothetical protein
MKKNYFGLHQTIFYQMIKINKTQLLLKYFFGARGVKFVEKRRDKYVSILLETSFSITNMMSSIK